MDVWIVLFLRPQLKDIPIVLTWIFHVYVLLLNVPSPWCRSLQPAGWCHLSRMSRAQPVCVLSAAACTLCQVASWRSQFVWLAFISTLTHAVYLRRRCACPGLCSGFGRWKIVDFFLTWEPTGFNRSFSEALLSNQVPPEMSHNHSRWVIFRVFLKHVSFPYLLPWLQ